MNAVVPRDVTLRGGWTVRLRALDAADVRRVVDLEHVLFGRSAWTYGMVADELGALGEMPCPSGPERAGKGSAPVRRLLRPAKRGELGSGLAPPPKWTQGRRGAVREDLPLRPPQGPREVPQAPGTEDPNG